MHEITNKNGTYAEIPHDRLFHIRICNMRYNYYTTEQYTELQLISLLYPYTTVWSIGL